MVNKVNVFFIQLLRGIIIFFSMSQVALIMTDDSVFLEKKGHFFPATLLDPSYDHNKIVPYKFLESQKSSYIVFVKDDEGNHYIIKQEKSVMLGKQMRAICEALCAHISLSLDIPSQYVRIIPVNVPFPGKFITKRVGTIHSLVPGETIRSNPNGLYAKLDIKQSTDKDLLFEQQGFNEKTIYWMSQHHQLPLIVALDTFVGNKDRNKANILYDVESNSFYAIDMALMYDIQSSSKPVAQIACDHVVAMIEQNKRFSEKELEALQAYRLMLKKLVHYYPPQTMCELFDDFFLESKITATPFFNAKEITITVNLYKRAIRQSYIDIKKLIYLLFILLNQQA